MTRAIRTWARRVRPNQRRPPRSAGSVVAPRRRAIPSPHHVLIDMERLSFSFTTVTSGRPRGITAVSGDFRLGYSGPPGAERE
jgi:hypothetical protein